MCSMLNFIAQKGKGRAVRDMNIRVGSPSLKANQIPVKKDASFDVAGYISNGESVGGNSKWYQTSDGNYIWSGNVELIKNEIVKTLRAPLAKLICTQGFGLRPEVYKDYGSPKGHNGLDFRTWVNGDSTKWKQPIFSVLDGTVSEAGNDQKFKGNYVRIRHQNGYESVYLHMDSIKVKKGDNVLASQEIGISGNTGETSEAPHLHFGYRPIKYDMKNGYMGYIDPLGLFIDEIKFV